MSVPLVAALVAGIGAASLLGERPLAQSAGRAYEAVAGSTHSPGQTYLRTARTRPTEPTAPLEASGKTSKAASPKHERSTSPSHIEERPRNSESQALASKIRTIAGEHRGAYGVLVWQPSSGKRYALNADRSFEAASLAKLPVLLALYREAAAGTVDLDKQIKLRPSDITGGTGTLQYRPPGTTLSLRECAYHLVSESDNTAWNMLERRITEKRIEAELVSVRAGSTNYESAEHTTTPSDILRMLERISEPGYTSPALTQEMLRAMTGTSFEGRLSKGVPEDARVAHKIGILGDSFSDAGVVYPQGEAGQRYYVVVLSEGTTETSSRDAMQKISRVTYDSLAGGEESSGR